MTEHLSTRQWEGYRSRTLDAAELLSACDHLAECASCASRLLADPTLGARVERLRAEFEAAGAPRHLSYEELADHADGRLGPVDREIVMSHLDICERCAEEARDLSLFRDTMGAAQRPSPPQILRPAGVERPRLERPALRWLAGLAAAAAMVSFVLLLARARQAEDLQKRVAELEQTNRILRAEAQSRAVTGPPAEIAQPAVALEDEGGRRVALDANGGLTGLPALEASLHAAVQRALTTSEVSTPATLAELIGRPETMLGSTGAASFTLLSPTGTVVGTDRPTFRWRPLSGNARYTVEVFDVQGDRVTGSPPLAVSEWRTDRALARGRAYAWQVTAVREGKEVIAPVPPAPPARFRVLELARLAELERAKASVAGSHLALGVAYAEAGLLDDSERELRELLRANPGSEVARRLLRSVEGRRRPS